MEIKGIKKGASLLSVFLIIIIGIFAFSGMFIFLVENAEEAGVTIDSRYNDTFNDVIAQHDDIEEITYNIRDSINDVEEADNAAESAFYGFKGMLALFKLPLQVLDSGLALISIALGALDIIPLWIRVTAFTGILIILVFSALRFITQRGNEA